MIFLLAAWAVLLPAAFGAGTFLLIRAGLSSPEQPIDRAIVAAWLGLLLGGAALLYLSVLVPLSPVTGLALLGLFAAAWLAPGVRREAAVLRPLLLSTTGLAGLLVALAVAAFGSQGTDLYDSTMYHFGAIEWLSDWGAVRGLGLLYDHYAFGSSWFALAAPFNEGPLRARVGTLTGGLAFLLAGLHALVALSRILAGRRSARDWFLVVAYTAVLWTVAAWGMAVSPSPDFTVIVLSLLVAWTLLGAAGKPAEERARAALLPLLLAAAAMTAKPSALPVAVVAGLFYLHAGGWRFRRWLVAAGIGAVLVGGNVGFSLVTTGCPLYPSPAGCLDLPWAVPPEIARAEVAAVRDWPRWAGGPKPPHATDWNWIGVWAEYQKLLLVLLGATVASAVVLARRAREIPGARWLLLLALGGSAYFLSLGPHLRFGMGYVIVLPALLAAERLRGLNPAAWRPFARAAGQPRLAFSALALLLGVLALPSMYVPGLPFNPGVAAGVVAGRVEAAEYERPLHLWAPPAMPPGNIVARRVNDVVYFEALTEPGCMAAPQPCTHKLTYPHIRLRDPSRGLGAGFVKARAADAEAAWR